MLHHPSLSEAKQETLTLLKRLGPSPAGRIAERLGTTAVATRQHLAALEEAGLVQAEPQPPTGRGRPSRGEPEPFSPLEYLTILS